MHSFPYVQCLFSVIHSSVCLFICTRGFGNFGFAFLSRVVADIVRGNVYCLTVKTDLKVQVELFPCSLEDNLKAKKLQENNILNNLAQNYKIRQSFSC